VSLHGGGKVMEHGDAGSMATNFRKEWVGMWSATIAAYNTGILTSSSDIFEDIELKTGGTIENR